jgi:putative N6-adenine-specific DNA methylase
MTVAPLKETLAAAVLALGRVPASLPFVDPMCGSGTLAIEQALVARRMAPGLSRSFGFQRWPGYRGAVQAAWDRMKERARGEALPQAPAPIVARDQNAKALDAARRNAAAAGVGRDVVVEEGDARRIEPRWPEGTLCTNPPYGERLGRPAAGRLQLQGLYRGLGETFRRFHGWHAVILSGNPLLEREMGMKPVISHRLWNGPIEARLLRYRIG